MNISEDTKLDFDDVLIRPKRSTIESRKDVDLLRKFKYKWSGIESLPIIPIVASNMDTTGTLAMGKGLHKHNMLVALHKYISTNELVQYFKEFHAETFVTIGLDDESLDNYKALHKFVGEISICL